MRVLRNYIPLAFAIALLGIAPLLHNRSLNDPILYPQLLAIAITGMLAAAALGITADASIKVQHWAWWPLGGLTLLTFLSSAWALNPAEAWFLGARWLIVGSVVLLAQVVLARWPDVLHTLCKVLVVAMSAIAVIGLLQAQGIDPLRLSDAYHSPNGTQANRNFYGSALLLGIPFTAYGMFKLGRGWQVAGGLAIGLMVTGIVVAGTRAALVPLLVGLVVFPPLVMARRLKGMSRGIALVAWVLLIALAGWSSQFVLKKKDARIHYALLWENGKVVTPTSTSLDFRLISWHHSLQMARERPWHGYGAGNWKLQIQRIGLQSFDDQGNFGMVVPLHPHNEFLVVLAELGIPGLLLLLAVWGVGIAGAARQALNSGGSHDSLLGICLLMAWLGMFIDASFSFPLERPFHMTLLGLLLALSLRGFKAATLSRGWLRLGLVAVAGMLLLAGIDVAARMQADAVIRDIRIAKDAHQPQKILQLRPQATSWATQLDPVAALSLDWYVAMAHAELQQLPAALQAFERSGAVSPHHLAQRSGQASLLDMTGQYATAIALQAALMEVYPNFTEGWINLSIMHIHAGQLPLGRQALSKAQRADFPERYDAVDAVLRQAGY